MRFNPKQKTYLLCYTGALGDTVSTFPTVKILAERGHVEKMFVDDRYVNLYKLVFDNDLIINLKDVTKKLKPHEITQNVPRDMINPETGEAHVLAYPIIPSIPVVETMKPLPSSIHMHLVDCFSVTMTDAILKENMKDYPFVPQDKLPDNICSSKNYVVIAYGSTTQHRKMLPEVFEKIKQYFLDKGTDVVLLGNTDHKLECKMTNGTSVKTQPTFEGASFEGCIDLINKTSIVEALRIIHDAKMIIGLDNGLIHLAGMTDVPIVAGYTTVDPYYRVPYRHGVKGWNCYVVEPTSECKYCQTEHFETYGINFLECGIMSKECMYSLTFDKWLAKIQEAELGF